MVKDSKKPPPLTSQPPRCLIAGNFCHDVLFQNSAVVAESLGGAVSFISAILDGLSIPFHSISKVGPDFKYPSQNRSFITVPGSKTTLFHAYFDTCSSLNAHQDRILKRVESCDPILPCDLPDDIRFDVGLAVGVGGEIVPETLEKMTQTCNAVFVDIQALIRVFDDADGTVKPVGLKESGFYHLLPRIAFLKASKEEALYMDLEEVRKWCCVVVTNGKDGCSVYWKDEEVKIAPFAANQVDPTGAGDSFLGGFVIGHFQGLCVPDAALLGNFFGSLTVGQVGLPTFDRRLLQGVKDEVQRRKMQCSIASLGSDNISKFQKLAGHDQFHSSLCAVKVMLKHNVQDCQRELPSPHICIEQPNILSSLES